MAYLQERKNRKRFMFFIDIEDLKSLKHLSADRNTSVSELVRQAIKSALEINK